MITMTLKEFHGLTLSMYTVYNHMSIVSKSEFLNLLH